MRPEPTLASEMDKLVECRGREEFIESILNRFEGPPSVTLIHGDSGIGKTTVMKKLVEIIRRRNSTDEPEPDAAPNSTLVGHFECAGRLEGDPLFYALDDLFRSCVGEQTSVLERASLFAQALGSQLSRPSKLLAVASSLAPGVKLQIAGSFTLLVGELFGVLQKTMHDAVAVRADQVPAPRSRIFGDAMEQIASISQGQTLVLVVDNLNALAEAGQDVRHLALIGILTNQLARMGNVHVVLSWKQSPDLHPAFVALTDALGEYAVKNRFEVLGLGPISRIAAGSWLREQCAWFREATSSGQSEVLDLAGGMPEVIEEWIQAGFGEVDLKRLAEIAEGAQNARFTRLQTYLNNSDDLEMLFVLALMDRATEAVLQYLCQLSGFGWRRRLQFWESTNLLSHNRSSEWRFAHEKKRKFLLETGVRLLPEQGAPAIARTYDRLLAHAGYSVGIHRAAEQYPDILDELAARLDRPRLDRRNSRLPLPLRVFLFTSQEKYSVPRCQGFLGEFQKVRSSLNLPAGLIAALDLAYLSTEKSDYELGKGFLEEILLHLQNVELIREDAEPVYKTLLKILHNNRLLYENRGDMRRWLDTLQEISLPYSGNTEVAGTQSYLWYRVCVLARAEEDLETFDYGFRHVMEWSAEPNGQCGLYASWAICRRAELLWSLGRREEIPALLDEIRSLAGRDKNEEVWQAYSWMFVVAHENGQPELKDRIYAEAAEVAGTGRAVGAVQFLRVLGKSLLGASEREFVVQHADGLMQLLERIVGDHRTAFAAAHRCIVRMVDLCAPDPPASEVITRLIERYFKLLLEGDAIDKIASLWHVFKAAGIPALPGWETEHPKLFEVLTDRAFHSRMEKVFVGLVEKETAGLLDDALARFDSDPSDYWNQQHLLGAAFYYVVTEGATADNAARCWQLLSTIATNDGNRCFLGVNVMVALCEGERQAEACAVLRQLHQAATQAAYGPLSWVQGAIILCWDETGANEFHRFYTDEDLAQWWRKGTQDSTPSEIESTLKEWRGLPFAKYVRFDLLAEPRGAGSG